VTIKPDSVEATVDGIRQLLGGRLLPRWENYEAFADWDANARGILASAGLLLPLSNGKEGSKTDNSRSLISRMKQKLLQLTRVFGYDVAGYRTFKGKPDPERPWEDDQSFLAAYDAVVNYTLVDRKRLYMLYQLVRQTASMKASVAECGVFRGGTALLFAKLKPEDKRLYLFDTFGGMPETAPEKDFHQSGDFSDTSLPRVQDLLRGYANVVFRPGFFPATASGLEQEAFSLVHCDMDIYSSVLDFCRFFYPRLVRGGVMVFDDYGYPSCPGAKAAVREFCAGQGAFEIYLPTGQAIVWKA
jgi:O-methyltransferase